MNFAIGALLEGEATWGTSATASPKDAFGTLEMGGASHQVSGQPLFLQAPMAEPDDWAHWHSHQRWCPAASYWQKFYLQPVAYYWQIATLLTNCNSCFYGNLTSQYFEVPTPEVEDYLKNGF